MGVLKKIYFLIFTYYSFNTFISANDDEIEYNDNEYDVSDGYGDDNIDEYSENYNDESVVDDDVVDDDVVDTNGDESYADNDQYYDEDYSTNDDAIDDEQIEQLRDAANRREEKSKKKFFESYNRLQRDVAILKARDPFHGKNNGRAKIDAQYKPFRIINLGIYGYSNVPSLIKYTLGNKNRKVPRKIKASISEENKNNILRGYILELGGCFNLNIGSGGLSVTGGYCVFEDTYMYDTIDTYVGFNVNVLFRFPVISIVDLIFNIIDPIGIALYFTGLRRRTEWLVGTKICFYESREIGVFNPGSSNNTFKELKKLKDDTTKTPFIKFSELLAKHCTIGRRVYVNEHFFYSITTSILAPVILVWLTKDCKEVKKFFTDCKYLESMLTCSIGILI